MARQKKSYDHIPADIRERLHIAVRRGYLDDWSSEWKFTFAGEFITHNPTRVKILDVFRTHLGRIPTWDDVTDQNLRQWRDLLSEKMCASSLHGRLKEISAAINGRLDSVAIPSRNYRKILRSKNQPSEAVFLTEDEIERLHNYQPLSAEEEYVKRIFMLGCYTLARHSDCLRFTEANIIGRNFTYTSEKTKVTAKLPVHRNLRQYLHGEQIPLWSYQFNGILRDICRNIGIDSPVTLFRRGAEETAPKYAFVTSHTARRSGATNLYLRGADILTISRMLGHSDVKTTQKYIVGYRPLSQAAESYFN